MGALIATVVGLWRAIRSFFEFALSLVAKLFNNVWAAGLLVLGVAFSLWHKGSQLLGAIADKLDSFHFATIGDGSVSANVRTILETANCFFPVPEAFTFIAGLISLSLLLIFIKLVLAVVGRILKFVL